MDSVQEAGAGGRRHEARFAESKFKAQSKFMPRPLIIAIDGPSGAGKSTLGRMLARELNLLYIDTGSMYRAVALAVMESSISSTDDVAVGSLAARVSIDLRGDPDSMEVTLDGRDVTESIRREEVTHLSSIISAIPEVRRAMVERQREMGKLGAVLNGRDIGTVVFPNADVKFFLTAVPDERAQRRFVEESVQDPNVDFEATFVDMTERDRRDSTRADSPLRIAENAVVIDSTGLSIDEVFAKMIAVVQATLATPGDW
ncbi:MAG: (d)CMP kinase [Acidobacteria bacterium]|nr:(d)CMP kinase [Acidobacteriota bacterium]